jgi:hypothetical protein
MVFRAGYSVIHAQGCCETFEKRKSDMKPRHETVSDMFRQ